MENMVTTGDRVRENTSSGRNMEIDERMFQNIRQYADKSDEEITRRIRELDREWDIERLLGVNMSALALTGIALSGFKGRSWLALPAVVLGFFAQHAVQGWCPPVTVLRAFSIRTRDEIEQEKHALKAMRGDYENVMTPGEAFVAARRLD